ncbi:MAG: DNA-formamidopyrimidine glycosylase family protein, partial [Verrucomicrobiota bacterium]
MPELAEVEAARRFAEHHLKGLKIDKAVTQPDTIVFPDGAEKAIPRKLKGRTVTACKRKGKHMWFELDQRPWPTLHFGMTGDFKVYGDTSERPKFWKLELQMSEGTYFAMINKRRLGRIRLLNDPENEPPISALGFDPYLDMPSTATFQSLVERRKTPVKALLLDQGFAAGVGNWLADDILYQAGIDPRRKAS